MVKIESWIDGKGVNLFEVVVQWPNSTESVSLHEWNIRDATTALRTIREIAKLAHSEETIEVALGLSIPEMQAVLSNLPTSARRPAVK